MNVKFPSDIGMEFLVERFHLFPQIKDVLFKGSMCLIPGLPFITTVLNEERTPTV